MPVRPDDVILYGGTFDPPHRGHDAVLGALLELGAKRVLLVPVGDGDHKPRSSAAPAQRLLWCQRWAAAHGRRVRVLDWQLDGSMAQCTGGMLGALTRREGPARRWATLGSDQLQSFPRWECPEKVLDRACGIIVAIRPGHPVDPAAVRWVRARGAEVLIVDCQAPQESSTRLRVLAAAGVDIAHLMAPGCA